MLQSKDEALSSKGTVAFNPYSSDGDATYGLLGLGCPCLEETITEKKTSLLAWAALHPQASRLSFLRISEQLPCS